MPRDYTRVLPCVDDGERRFQAAGQIGGRADLPEVDKEQARLLVYHVIVNADGLKVMLGQGRQGGIELASCDRQISRCRAFASSSLLKK